MTNNEYLYDETGKNLNRQIKRYRKQVIKNNINSAICIMGLCVTCPLLADSITEKDSALAIAMTILVTLNIFMLILNQHQAHQDKQRYNQLKLDKKFWDKIRNEQKQR